MSSVPAPNVRVKGPARKKRKKRKRTFASGQELWSKWYRGTAALKFELPGQYRGVFQIRDRRTQQIIFTDRDGRGGLLATMHRALTLDKKRKRYWDPRTVDVRYAVYANPRQLTKKLALARAMVRRDKVTLNAWSDWHLLQPAPSVALLPTRLFGVYEVAECVEGEMVSVYGGKSERCVRKRLYRHFQKPYHDPDGRHSSWYATPAPNIYIRWMFTLKVDVDEAEWQLIRTRRPRENKDKMERGYNQRLPMDLETVADYDDSDAALALVCASNVTVVSSLDEPKIPF